MKYLRLIKTIWFIVLAQFEGLSDKIVKEFKATKRWSCFHCGSRWLQSFDNDRLCTSCRGKQEIAFGVSKPKMHTQSWRRTLSHLPGEIEAIEAGVYEPREVNQIIREQRQK